MGLNLASLLTESAERAPDSPAIRLGELELSYGELDERSARLATLLSEKGIEPGDRVGVMLPNVPDFPVAYYGVLQAGGIVVPMNVLLKRREIAFYLEDSGAKLLLAWHGFAEEARDGAADAGAEMIEVEPASFASRLAEHEPTAGLVDTAEDDTAVILYTSGTTGRPKGAELTHRNIHLNAQRSASVIQEMTPDDVVMGCLPLFHVFGLVVGLNAATVVGASLALIPRFDPAAAIEVIEKERVTIMQGVPTMYAAILNHPQSDGMDASSLRVCASGGSAMPLEVMRSFEDKFGCIILEGYGLSETSPVASFNMPTMERKPGTIGVAIPGCEMKCVDLDGNEVPVGEVGEIAIRGDNV
ncbi:MAG TPA: AMP-binding protein, partial [Solirubrobacterales bacterium]